MLWGTISPVGTLMWGLNQGAERLGWAEMGLKQKRPKNLLQYGSNSVANSSDLDCYIVFLPGIGDFSGDELTHGEAAFLDHLVQLHPRCVAVRDVFPYSIVNESLGGQRLLAPLWRFAHEHKADRWLGIADVLNGEPCKYAFRW